MKDYITTIRLQNSTKEIFNSCNTPKLSDDKKLLLLSNLWLNRQKLIDLSEGCGTSMKTIIKTLSKESVLEIREPLLKVRSLLLELQEILQRPKAPKVEPSFLDKGFSEVMREISKNKKEKENE